MQQNNSKYEYERSNGVHHLYALGVQPGLVCRHCAQLLPEAEVLQDVEDLDAPLVEVRARHAHRVHRVLYLRGGNTW